MGKKGKKSRLQMQKVKGGVQVEIKKSGRGYNYTRSDGLSGVFGVSKEEAESFAGMTDEEHDEFWSGLEALDWEDQDEEDNKPAD